jgi:hypothetical protein
LTASAVKTSEKYGLQTISIVDLSNLRTPVFPVISKVAKHFLQFLKARFSAENYRKLPER